MHLIKKLFAYILIPVAMETAYPIYIYVMRRGLTGGLDSFVDMQNGRRILSLSSGFILKHCL
jgi:hypothetical protein